MDLHIDLENASKSFTVPPLDSFYQWAATALENVRETAELSIRIVDTEEGARLNEHWRNRAGPTNVLSFPANLPDVVDLPLLGDLVICAPVVSREAAEHAKEEMAHWAHLVIHGILHLIGYDHIEEKDAIVMEAMETRLLKRLGYRDPYQHRTQIADHCIGNP
jgi:probable rRNA maturation factor